MTQDEKVIKTSIGLLKGGEAALQEISRKKPLVKHRADPAIDKPWLLLRYNNRLMDSIGSVWRYAKEGF